MPSDKLPVIERIWEMLEKEGKGRRTVYFEDVRKAISYCNSKDNKRRSVNNLANFMKDLVRSDAASGNWPDALKALRIGARQRVGKDRVFEFRDYAADDIEPFPNRYSPKPDDLPVVVQSLSLPLASKALGRRDESWLIQVAVALNVLEQHFAHHSHLGVKELVHLQTGVKLANSEIDGLFRAIIEKGGKRRHVLVTCEAKQQGQRILDFQVVEQIVAAHASIKDSVPEEELSIDLIVPVAIKAIPPSGDIYVVEFEPWTPEEASVAEEEQKELAYASSGVYRLSPPVPGIGFSPPRLKRRRLKKA